MGLNNAALNCVECEFMRMYDYGNRIYYCDHVDRTDDMGKLSVDHPPEGRPVWCPVRENDGEASDSSDKLETVCYYILWAWISNKI